MNEDLLRNSFDGEYKDVAETFAHLLQQIVETVDKYGLKQRHLGKHRHDAVRFLKSVERRAIRRQSQQSIKNEWVNMAQGFSLSWTTMECHGITIMLNMRFMRLREFADLLTADSPRTQSESTLSC